MVKCQQIDKKSMWKTVNVALGEIFKRIKN